MVQIGLGYVNGLRSRTTRRPWLKSGSARGASAAWPSWRRGPASATTRCPAWRGRARASRSSPMQRARAREARRIALWRLGVAQGSGPNGQLSLPLPLPEAPKLRELDEWEVAVADYASTGMTLGAHPLALIRHELEEAVVNADLAVLPDRREVEIAGIVVARQRPGNGQGHRLHAARGRDGRGERDRAAARLHRVPPRGEDGVLRARRGAPGAARQGDQRPREHGWSRSPLPTCHRPRSARSSPIRSRETGRTWRGRRRCGSLRAEAPQERWRRSRRRRRALAAEDDDRAGS